MRDHRLATYHPPSSNKTMYPYKGDKIWVHDKSWNELFGHIQRTITPSVSLTQSIQRLKAGLRPLIIGQHNAQATILAKHLNQPVPVINV